MENINSTTAQSSVPCDGCRPATCSSAANIPVAWPWYLSRCSRKDSAASKSARLPDWRDHTPGALTPSDKNSPNYSRSGSYGNPTLATLAKGEDLLAAILDDLIEQVAVFIAKDLTDKPRPEAMQSVLR